MEFGGPEALQIVEVPDVHAGPGEVRLRVHAATVNPTDTHARNGNHASRREPVAPPHVPGMDAAGVVDEVGEVGDGVDTEIAVGDRAMGIVVPRGAHGAYRQSLVLPAGSVAKAPAGSSHAEASTLPMNGLTARLCLDLLDLEAGQTIAVTGAAGAFGGYVVQLAKADGLTVVADASVTDAELVSDLGADVVVARGDDFAASVRAHFPNGVHGLADGSVQNELVIDAVADGGAYNSVRGYTGEPQRDITFTTTWVTEYQHDHDKLDRLRQQAEDGVLSLRVAEIFPAERASDAHARLEAGGTRGRCVIDLSKQPG
jgi:NADPH:quinone reductase-like Zn-dependent oxidoreductase